MKLGEATLFTLHKNKLRLILKSKLYGGIQDETKNKITTRAF